LSKNLKSHNNFKAPILGVFLALAGGMLLISPLGKGLSGQYGYAPGDMPPEVQSALEDYKSEPEDRQIALKTARALINEGRLTGNAEIVAKADSILSSISGRENMTEALKLRAISQQYLHNFDEALSLLELALSLDGKDATALLTRANILLVQGKIKAAKEACVPLGTAGRYDLLLLCDSTAKALGPEAQNAAAQLNAVLESRRMDPALIGYAYSVLGEMAMFQGDDALAQARLEKAQAADPQTLRIRMLHADSLLALRQPEAALKTLDIPVETDAFLLRRALAYKQSGQDEKLSDVSEEMDRRIRANFRVGHNGHAREEARYFLDVKEDADKALERARTNWQAQREYEDAWLFIDAAKAAGKPAEADPVRDWMNAQNVVAPGLVSRLPNRN
jgi:tetratricopeptide (TPR) repeat protein